ncbi:MAG: branched-chain amino acid transaminase [Chloroflexi bacterium]|nr:branched-chain amino acid transaminase [Chloroflexota bacterium]MBU1749200.1 branched-chain amino acid transaminase [Chloroflexota bacterium]
MAAYAYFRGQIVPLEQANVNVMTHAFNYGTGCFEGIRAYWNEEQEQLFLFRMREHFERLRCNCRVIHIDVRQSVKELEAITIQVLRACGFRQDTYVRPLAYKSSEGIGVRLHDLEDDLTIFAVPFGKYIEKEEGASACVSSWRRLDDNTIPARAKLTGAYVNSALAKTDAVHKGFDEAIVLTHDGHVSEGSAENFFLVRNGALITPPVTDNILEGITRDTVMELAKRELGIPTRERTIDRSELYAADEAFFCGTGVQVAAVVSIDHRPVGDGIIGPITKQIRDLYFAVVRGQLPAYAHWLTPVYEA